MKASFQNHLRYSLVKDEYSATRRDCFESMVRAVRDRLVDRWTETQQTYYRRDAKRVYYLSLEFLMGRALRNALLNLDLETSTSRALAEMGTDLSQLEDIEFDAALGNGGLGRLAACFLDSMATLELPAYGYGIRYEFGIFFQRIRDGYQVETPDNWLRYGNPWEIERPEYLYPVKFYGRVNRYHDRDGTLRCEWVDAEEVMAMAYDTPVPGFRNNTVNNLRLWAAKSTREFDLRYFNDGDYEKAVSDKALSETISKVLYPNDNALQGKELRLKQEYFFVSATLQDILRRYKKSHPESLDAFPDAVAIQLNDTHPAVAIPELMRLFLDAEGLGWGKAWDLTVKTFGYTNHTVLPEALEKWPVDLFGRLLPRHLEIIYEINQRFLDEIRKKGPPLSEQIADLSIIEEDGGKKVRMSHLAIVGSHSVNGVSALHTDILKNVIFSRFQPIFPERFNNKTNGITPRRWLALCNPGLAKLITRRIGDGWLTDLSRLREIEGFAADGSFREEWRDVKDSNKARLADLIKSETRTVVDPKAIVYCQVKRMHEYKRQLLSVMHLIALYNRLKADPQSSPVPKTFVFSGKAAPGYFMAKLIIKLIHSVADCVNHDRSLGDRLKVAFLPNYGVSLAEKIIPGADVSLQISTAGTEASGTGNMKFALNGAVTVGTLDGANVEIREEVGDGNIFIFGLTARETSSLRSAGYSPLSFYEGHPELRQVLDMIADGFFSASQPDLFRPLTDSLLGGDPYFLLADFPAYALCHEAVEAAYRDRERWTRMSIANVARSGKFSSDRTVREYAKDIWNAEPVPIRLPVKK